MKKQFVLSLILLAVAPACVKRKKNLAKQADYGAVIVEEQGSTKLKETFLDDAEEFVLVEEENPFTGTSNKGLPLVSEEETDRSAYDRSEQAQYGLKTIYFDFDKFKIDASQKAALDENTKKIKELADKGHTIVIEGHACKSAGSSVYNLMLSEKRAKNVATEVKKHLVKNGVSKDALKIVGRGFEMCIVQDGDRTQQKPNRRVEFQVL